MQWRHTFTASNRSTVTSKDYLTVTAEQARQSAREAEAEISGGQYRVRSTASPSQAVAAESEATL